MIKTCRFNNNLRNYIIFPGWLLWQYYTSVILRNVLKPAGTPQYNAHQAEIFPVTFGSLLNFPNSGIYLTSPRAAIANASSLDEATAIWSNEYVFFISK